MKSIRIFVILLFLGLAASAQNPWWPTHESIILNPSENDEVCEWDPAPFSLNPNYPFLNLLTEQQPSFSNLECDALLGKWRLGGDVTTFFRDAEFASKHTRGYTALGYFLTPHVSSLFRKDAQITLGADLTGIAGLDGFWKARPLVRLEYQPNVHWFITMGNLYGGNSHHLYEPMWCLENTILDHTEQGLEITNFHRFGFSGEVEGDTWINWQDFLQPWEPKQEIFTAGTSQRITFGRPFVSSKSKDKFVKACRLRIPFSFVGQHHGGQFTSLDTCVTSLFNESVGIAADFFFGDFGFYNGTWLSIDLPLFAYQNASPGDGGSATPYSDGYGFYPQITYQKFVGKSYEDSKKDRDTWHRYSAQIAYWYGSQWIAPVGSYHFQSVSWHLPNYTDPTRSMLTSRFAYEHYRNRITFGADLQFYYDLNASQVDCAFGLYMRAKL